jgi:hypothetical protein
MRFGEVKNP